jgi:predicted molibdopterin-dependent oxidoreductase YjgC
MEKKVTISIDSHEVHAQEGTSILEAADRAEIYIPRLCYHPDLPPGPGTKAVARVYRHGEINADAGSEDKTHDGCNLCIIEIEGRGTALACTTPVDDGMIIHSKTASVRELRRDNLAQLISRHPHACILCSEKDGCDRDGCTQGVEKQSRCCPKFENCEFRKVAEYITIKENVSQYIFKNDPVLDTALFTFDANLCIECTRCIRACAKTQENCGIGFVYHDNDFFWGTLCPTHKESGCVFCGACVTACPTGALMPKGLPWKKKEKLNFTPIISPPEEELALNEENINKTPDVSGVYQLIDEKHEVLFIKGTDNLQRDLQEKLNSSGNARFFRYEEHGMYSMRENELLAGFLNKNGKLPEVNNEISDLY